MKLIIVIAFLLIFASLGSAFFYMMRDKGQTNRTVHALMLRVGFSIALILFILFAHWMGWIQSTGIPA